MKLKVVTLILLIFGLTACNHTLDRQSSGQAGTISFNDKEIFSLYKKVGTVMHVARALETASDYIDLSLYEINTSIAEGAKQRFISVEHLTRRQLDSTKSKLQTDYTWTPTKGNDVLFVQIQPKGFKDEMQLIDKRQEIETMTSKALQHKKLGEWFARDLGPGGGNILYHVGDINRSIEVILNVLHQNGLEKNVLIGKRVLIDKENWFYEVIYPTNYTGDFNTM